MEDVSDTIAQLGASERRARRRRTLLTVVPVLAMLGVYSALVVAVTSRSKELHETSEALKEKRAELGQVEEDLAEANEKRAELGKAVSVLEEKNAHDARQERAIASAVARQTTPEAAVAEVRALVQGEPATVPPRVRAIALWNQGYTASNNGDEARAEQLYLSAKAADPSYAPPYNSLGRLAYDRGDLAKADALYIEALKRDPNYAPAIHNRSLIAKKQGRTGEAVELNEKALKLRPGYAPAVNMRENLAATQAK